ncbi:MAG: amidohydrolase family protein [Clostridiales bacterium]|nr:amidohydrolase family protein [Clostridiales bacterium]
MKYAYVNGILLNGSADMAAQEGKVVLTDGEKITAVSDWDETDLSGYTQIDLAGKYLMPGLINLHVHLPGSGKPSSGKGDVAKLVKLVTSNPVTMLAVQKICTGYARQQLFSGVTTIRTVGGITDVDSTIRDRIQAGKLVGPRILAGNMAVSVPGGHMAGSLAYAATSPQEARNFVRKIAAGKPDLIKLMITGGVLDAKTKGEPGALKMQPELVRAACDEAHRLGLTVAAHVESPEGVRVALENGVDTIEHGAKPDDEIIRLFRERGACHIATFSPALPYALFDRSVSHASEMEQYNGKIVFDGIIACAVSCLKNGIPVGLGTDTGCPYITHYDMWREVYYFHKFCGVSNAFALYTATKRNAELAGLGSITGSIEERKFADFLITEKNPLEDLQALRKPAMVVARGRIFKSPHVKKSPVVEQELDKYL